MPKVSDQWIFSKFNNEDLLKYTDYSNLPDMLNDSVYQSQTFMTGTTVKSRITAGMPEGVTLNIDLIELKQKNSKLHSAIINLEDLGPSKQITAGRTTLYNTCIIDGNVGKQLTANGKIAVKLIPQT